MSNLMQHFWQIVCSACMPHADALHNISAGTQFCTVSWHKSCLLHSVAASLGTTCLRCCLRAFVLAYFVLARSAATDDCSSSSIWGFSVVTGCSAASLATVAAVEAAILAAACNLLTLWEMT